MRRKNKNNFSQQPPFSDCVQSGEAETAFRAGILGGGEAAATGRAEGEVGLCVKDRINSGEIVIMQAGAAQIVFGEDCMDILHVRHPDLDHQIGAAASAAGARGARIARSQGRNARPLQHGLHHLHLDDRPFLNAD